MNNKELMASVGYKHNSFSAKFLYGISWCSFGLSGDFGTVQIGKFHFVKAWHSDEPTVVYELGDGGCARSMPLFLKCHQLAHEGNVGPHARSFASDKHKTIFQCSFEIFDHVCYSKICTKIFLNYSFHLFWDYLWLLSDDAFSTGNINYQTVSLYDAMKHMRILRWECYVTNEYLPRTIVVDLLTPAVQCTTDRPPLLAVSSILSDTSSKYINKSSTMSSSTCLTARY